MRVAIIGAGPRGLWAAEELMARARERGARSSWTSTTTAPSAVRAGPAPTSPACLPAQWLLNVPSEVVETHLSLIHISEPTRRS